MEWRFGATLGKDFLKLRVRSLDQPNGKLTWMQAAKRMLRFAGIVPLLVVALVSELFLREETMNNWTLVILFYGAAFVITFAILANFVVATRRGRRPWHDRWANTAVILGREQSIPAGQPAPG